MSNLKEVRVPDLGNVSGAAIIEIPIKVGESIQAEQALITLESDKASMDIPAPFAGKVKEIKVKVGDKVSKGDFIVLLEVGADAAAVEEKPAPKTETTAPKVLQETAKPTETATATVNTDDTAISSAEDDQGDDVHAGPGVRRLAREFGLDLNQIKGTGQKGRVVKEDLQNFVKSRLSQTGQSSGTGSGLPSAPQIDFSQFGETENKPLSRIKKLSAQYLHRNWLLVPHVTQFNDADITELEAFRKAQAAFAAKQNVKLTPLVFIMKAVVTALKAFPAFNSSLSADGEQLILKKYFHIGIAVDTPEGLVVPVIRDVDKKSLLELAKELAEVSNKARLKQLSSADMQGSSFTISSLGGIGGTAFTPIVNLPDVAILGVSKAQFKPQYQDGEFIPRLMLPLCLSYDHRVIDGAEGARFIVFLADCLSDIRRWLL
ncbi:dihydrolipoamide acetyltransferase component of pyruvate dehydrogenase complex [Candidatus Rickettsiella viridis]|uniref:Acetyltransferase component of pyruvate dehydrogenase complex n=1 Tax=Candidatus Rickettsiella viridis TaxID=676208 RepID=A0A2Z5UWP4_9COXI|nr:dihydrolipoyllysine-residue acetyltransferase [Candidatus Rickettsiella viridis]BBB15433.1 dihydrolipoamide acetyltransferase component of pyruvate dehydrogenase complex [Candidatus Rickettsiella viridis]